MIRRRLHRVGLDRRLQKADLLKEATDGGLVHIEGLLSGLGEEAAKGRLLRSY